MSEHRPLLFGKRNAEFHGQQSEQRRELDDRVQRHRRRIFERIAYRVAHDSRVVQRRAFLLELRLDNLLRVVPRAAARWP